LKGNGLDKSSPYLWIRLLGAAEELLMTCCSFCVTGYVEKMEEKKSSAFKLLFLPASGVLNNTRRVASPLLLTFLTSYLLLLTGHRQLTTGHCSSSILKIIST